MLKFQREILKEFEPLKKKKIKIILFGSVAKGNYKLDSDIDLAIISDKEEIKKEAEEIADKILFKYGKVVSLKFLSKSELNKKTPFIKEVLKGKVI